MKTEGLIAKNKEKMGQLLLTAAEILGIAMNNISKAAQSNAEAIILEPEAYEEVILDGQGVLRSLKILAFGFDKTSLLKFKGGEK